VGHLTPPFFGRFRRFGGTFNTEKGGLLLPFEGIQGIFQGIHASSPPIKGGPLPPHSNNTQERKSTKARARATLLNGLRP